MTLIQLLLLVISAVTNSPESKSLAQAAQSKSTCGIRRLDTFDMMLTCYFHDNISAIQKDFTVYLFQEQGRETVLSCGWRPEIDCYVAPGYKYEYDIDVNHDHTNVRLLNASEEHVGMYTCQVMGESDPGNCNFTKDQIRQNSTLTPNTQQTSITAPAQTTTTSSLPDDRQTQSADEQSSAASKLSALKDAPGGRPAEEHKQTGSQDSTVVAVVPSVVLPVLLTIITIIAVIVAIYCWRKQRRSPSTVHEGGDENNRQEQQTLLKRQQDEHHSDISSPNPEDSQLTDQEDRQETPVESGRQETELKTRCKTDGDSCLEADSKPLMSESSELEKTGIQELGDVDVEDDETSFDGRQPELQQRDSHIDAPKKLNKVEEEDSPVPLHLQHDM